MSQSGSANAAHVSSPRIGRRRLRFEQSAQTWGAQPPPRAPVAGTTTNDININAGTILDHTESVAGVVGKVFEEAIAVACGRAFVRAEQAGLHTEFKIWESL